MPISRLNHYATKSGQLLLHGSGVHSAGWNLYLYGAVLMSTEGQTMGTDSDKKIVLITGASSGIGKATAKRLLKENYIVYATSRQIERMEDLEQQGAITLKLDVSKEDELQKAVATIRSDHGGVDILVNNAGFGMYGAMEDTKIDDARYQFEVNFFGLARLTQLVLPHMREQRFGKIVNMSSMGGKIYTPLGSWYHATKHAIEGWSDCLRLEVSPFGIHVIIIEPGIIETEFADTMIKPMLERSCNSAYKDLAERMARATRKTYSDGSPPSLIADVIAQALNAKTPRTRYSAGKLAKLMINVRKWLGDTVYDRALMSSM